MMKDMACRTISHFKGFTFSQLERFFKSDIGLYELIKILKLKRANLLEFDESNKLIVHKKYEERCFNRCFKSVRSYKIALWAVFTLYIMFILCCIYYFELKNTLENILVLGILIGIWEVVMLLKIENRERIEWFKNEGQEILNKNNFENLFRT